VAAPDNTRLVFDLSGPVQHSVFTLTAPDRLVIDYQRREPSGRRLEEVSTANTPIHRDALCTAHADRPAGGHRPEKAVTPKAFRWRRTRSMATVWWSICSTTPPMPPRLPADAVGTRPCLRCR